MKVVHLCLASFYIDNFSYQENLLPKYHKNLGYDVEIIASLETFDDNGKKTYLNNESEYMNEHNIKVKRLNFKFNNKLARKLKLFNGTFEAIETARPDILFIHGCQFLDIKEVVKYLKKAPETKVYVDNHADFSNSATNWLSRNFLHRRLWRKCAHLIEPYTEKFYGVLPARVDFLLNEYKLPKHKVNLLVMGADDEVIYKINDNNRGSLIRKEHNIEEDDFLIVTGGKIDKAKVQTIYLMEAIKKLNSNKVKLIVFGSITNELKHSIKKLVDNNVIQYIGWISPNEAYEYFSAADLVAFPGRHSVFWEQVVGIGTPMLVKYWAGTTHIDVGGNVQFLYEDNTNEILHKVKEIINNNELYNEMLSASEFGKEEFSYLNIARKSIDAKALLK